MPSMSIPLNRGILTKLLICSSSAFCSIQKHCPRSITYITSSRNPMRGPEISSTNGEVFLTRWGIPFLRSMPFKLSSTTSHSLWTSLIFPYPSKSFIELTERVEWLEMGVENGMYEGVTLAKNVQDPKKKAHFTYSADALGDNQGSSSKNGNSSGTKPEQNRGRKGKFFKNSDKPLLKRSLTKRRSSGKA